MAVRVHELAVELEIEASDLIVQLETLNIPARNHMSRVKDDDLDRVYEHYKKLNNPRAIEWIRLRASEKQEAQQAVEAQQRRIDEALAIAKAARAQAEAERRSAAATVERQRVTILKKASEQETGREAPAAPLTFEQPADRNVRPECRLP